MTVLIRPQGTLEIGPLTDDVFTDAEFVAYTETFSGSSTSTRGWSSVPGITVAISTAIGRTAAGSLILQRQAGSGSMSAKRTFTGLDIGRSYTFEAWARTSVSSATVSVGVDGIGSGSTAAITPGPTFSHVEYTFTATATSHDLQLLATVLSSNNTYWDDFKLTAHDFYSDTPMLAAEDGSARLDAMGVPYATARVVVPILDPNLPELIDPRIGVRAVLTGEDQEAGTSRTFDLGVRSRRVNHADKTVELELASDEALLTDYAPLTNDTGARTHEASLRALVNYVLGKVGAALESGPWDADVTAHWELTNLMPNPTVQTAVGNWVAGGTNGTLTRGGTSGSTPIPFTVGYTQTDWTGNSGTGEGGAAVTANTGPWPNVRPSTMHTISVYARVASGTKAVRLRARSYDSNNGLLKSPTVATATLTTSWQRITATFLTPAGAATVAPYLSADTGTQWVNGDRLYTAGWLLTEGTEVVPYFDGNNSAASGYTLAWDDATNASPSTRTPVVERDPDLFVWGPGVSAWEFLQPFTASTSTRLFCDEQRKWWLIEPGEYSVPGVVTISPDNTTEGSDLIELGDPDIYCTGVVVVYSWTDSKGVERTRRDTAGSPGLVLVQEINRPYPGPGVAAWMLNRRTGQGRLQEVTALVDWTTTPAMQVSVTLPGTLDQVGQVEAVEWGFTDGLMAITTRALTDIIPGSWASYVGDAWNTINPTLKWEDA